MTRPARGVSIAVLAAIGFLGLGGALGFRRSPEAALQLHVVEIRGMEFHPRELEVHRGDTVLWINRDLVPHTATSTRKAGWNTGPLQEGDSGRYIPRHTGEDAYICQLHPVMRGKLLVR
ncbi:MAG TPA: plastocyanin/azurin family copper-binding protein [Gemmatimonadales bacterium]